MNNVGYLISCVLLHTERENPLQRNTLQGESQQVDDIVIYTMVTSMTVRITVVIGIIILTIIVSLILRQQHMVKNHQPLGTKNNLENKPPLVTHWRFYFFIEKSL